MSKVIFKTLFSSKFEIPFIKMNLIETRGIVDEFIVCEFNRTHTGQNRDYVFNEYIGDLDDEDRNRLNYFAVDLDGEFLNATDDSESAHINEDLMRGYFTQLISLSKRDIIISADADEVIHAENYNYIINSLNFFTRAVKIELNQFFYRLDYFWVNERFVGPTVCYANYYKKNNSRWRYDGKLLKGQLGCHFSWCIPPKEMLKKISSNAHQADYAHLVNLDVLKKAIDQRTYPFDETRKFKLIKTNRELYPELYPKSIGKVINEFCNIGEDRI